MKEEVIELDTVDKYNNTTNSSKWRRIIPWLPW